MRQASRRIPLASRIKQWQNLRTPWPPSWGLRRVFSCHCFKTRPRPFHLLSPNKMATSARSPRFLRMVCHRKHRAFPQPALLKPIFRLGFQIPRPRQFLQMGLQRNPRIFRGQTCSSLLFPRRSWRLQRQQNRKAAISSRRRVSRGPTRCRMPPPRRIQLLPQQENTVLIASRGRRLFLRRTHCTAALQNRIYPPRRQRPKNRLQLRLLSQSFHPQLSQRRWCRAHPWRI